MKYVGVDLTSAFSNQPRSIDVAVIDGESFRPSVSFHQVQWPTAELVVARDTQSLYAMLRGVLAEAEEAVFAIDGPQGLADNGTGRACEFRLGTPGRTPVTPPATHGGGPFQPYIRSSIDLFNALLQTPLSLAGLNGTVLGNATLFEIFPGSEWTVFAGRRLARKASLTGRQQRLALFQHVLRLPQVPLLPTPDQFDALAGAYLVWCTRNRPTAVELVGNAPTIESGELREGYILHATQAPPRAADVTLSSTEPPELVAPAEAVAPPPDEGWADDALLLYLTDYPVVWGSEPEDAWMQPNQNYVCQTLAPHPIHQFTLTYAPTVSGQRGWRCTPTVMQLLRLLNLPSPPGHLGRVNAVTLRVRVVQ